MRVAHLTTVDMSLRYLLLPQLVAVVELGGEAVGISAPGPDVARLEALGIRHIALPGATRSVDPVKDVRAMKSLWRILRDERFDVIHTHTPKPGLYGRVIGRVAGVPAVLNTVHGLYATPDDSIVKRAIVYALEAFAARFSDLELVQSAEDFRLVTERRITRPNRTVLLGNGVDLARFDSKAGSAAERARIRAEFRADDDQIVVGMVGRLVAEKGFVELFQAVRELDDRFRIVVIGPHEPDKADAIETSIIDAAQAAGVVFLGMREDVDAMYRGMDLFVLPSHREGFPRAAMEAAASGLPLIVTDIRGCREVVDDGVNGLLVPVRSATALRDAIERLGDNAALRRQMGEASRSKAVHEFDEQLVVQRVIGAQVRVLREKGRFEPFGTPDFFVRRAETRDAKIIAGIHATRSGGRSANTRLVTRACLRLIDDPHAVVLVGDDGFGPVAYVVGVMGGRSSNGPARWFRPARDRRPTQDHAELLAVGVASPFAESGVVALLAGAFVRSVSSQGDVRLVRTVVDVRDGRTMAALQSAGFANDPEPGQGPFLELWAHPS